MTVEEADDATWHALRTTFASSLGADNRSIEEIEDLLRWRSAASVRLYREMRPDEYATKVTSGLRKDGSKLAQDLRPVVDYDDAIEVIAHALEKMKVSEGASGTGGAEKAALQVGVELANKINARAATRAKDGSSAAASVKKEKVSASALKKSGKRAEPSDNSAGSKTRSVKARRNVRVVVSKSVWPDERCLENKGRGWSGTIATLPNEASSALVMLDHREDGVKPRAWRLRLDVLSFVEA